jgi:hypothetical protein
MSGLREMLAGSWPLLLLAALLVSGFVLFRSHPTELGSEDALNDLLSGGHPIILELYSNF